jgi:hypothetical protein
MEENDQGCLESLVALLLAELGIGHLTAGPSGQATGRQVGIVGSACSMTRPSKRCVIHAQSNVT